jgi:hypothetical protein
MTDSGPRIPTVNARRLATVLEEAGWRRVGGRRDVYSRFAPPGAESERYGGLVVPLDSAAPEYQELMDAAIAELSSAQHRDIWQRTIMPRLSLEQADDEQIVVLDGTGLAAPVPVSESEEVLDFVWRHLAPGYDH